MFESFTSMFGSLLKDQPTNDRKGAYRSGNDQEPPKQPADQIDALSFPETDQKPLKQPNVQIEADGIDALSCGNDKEAQNDDDDDDDTFLKDESAPATDVFTCNITLLEMMRIEEKYNHAVEALQDEKEYLNLAMLPYTHPNQAPEFLRMRKKRLYFLEDKVQGATYALKLAKAKHKQTIGKGNAPTKEDQRTDDTFSREIRLPRVASNRTKSSQGLLRRSVSLSSTRPVPFKDLVKTSKDGKVIKTSSSWKL